MAKKHNPKAAAAIVLIAGAALAGVSAKHISDKAERERDLPTFVDIPSTLEVSPEEGALARTYKVSGMCCESCTQKLYVRISDLDGVDACAVDLQAEELSVIVKREVTAERLLSTLTFDKYSAVELQR